MNLKQMIANPNCVSADDALFILEGMIERGKTEFSKEAKEYAFEWLFDCVHCTGYTNPKCIVDIYEDTVKQIKEGEF